MRIAKRHILSSESNTLYTVFAVAVSLFVFAYSTRFGKLPILALYGVWALPLLFEPRLLLRQVPTLLLLSSLAALAIASTLWSDNASATLRAGIQYASTVACAFVAARVITMRGLAIGGLVGSALVIVYSLHIGRYEYDALDSTYALVGAFRSKNQLGFYASLAIVFGAALMAQRGTGPILKSAALAVCAAGATTLFATQSATSIVTVVVALALMLGLMGAGRLSPNHRLGLALVGVIVIIGGGAAALEAGAFSGLLEVFGKDATLTGRTYLWREGITAAQENLFVGGGYNAFWTIGNSPAERLWDEFYITARTGFHFHNAFIEMAVGLGLLGLALLVIFLLSFIATAAAVLFAGRLEMEPILAITLGALLIMRSMVEIDFLTPYTVGTFLLYFSFLRLIAWHREAVARRAPRSAKARRLSRAPRPRAVPHAPSAARAVP